MFIGVEHWENTGVKNDQGGGAECLWIASHFCSFLTFNRLGWFSKMKGKGGLRII